MKTSALYELLANEWVSKVILRADEEDELGYKKKYKQTRKLTRRRRKKTFKSLYMRFQFESRTRILSRINKRTKYRRKSGHGFTERFYRKRR